MPNLPAIGDKFFGIVCIWTVSALREGHDLDNEPITVIELTHPVAGELVLPAEDFAKMVARGSLEVAP